MFRKILVPLDGSDLSEMILPQVEDLAKAFQAEITLINVGSLLTEGSAAAAIFTGADAYTSEIKKKAEAKLAEIAARLKAKGVNVNYIFLTGSPAREIVSYAEEKCCDLIALATHARSEIAWVLGSIAETIAAHATVPVLMLRVLKTAGAESKEACQTA